jgi:hypothetical protein
MKCSECFFYKEGLSAAKTVNHEFDLCYVMPTAVRISNRERACMYFKKTNEETKNPAQQEQTEKQIAGMENMKAPPKYKKVYLFCINGEAGVGILGEDKEGFDCYYFVALHGGTPYRIDSQKIIGWSELPELPDNIIA